jgi:predicted nuclease of predicted toxin-antitoxin system
VNLLADENVDRPIVERLRRDGHHVQYIVEMQTGVSDDEVLDEANSAHSILITADKDFADLIFLQNRIAEGILLIRLQGLSAERKAEVVASAILQHGPELSGAFTVVSRSSIRIRRKNT